ncbi:MAG: hypothetical protein AAFU64_09400, partial [Bacteroidota bacterium]
YTSKNALGSPSVFDATRALAMQPTADRSLYNGNISTWVSHMNQQNPTANRYQYDRLNRIKNSQFRQWDGSQWQDSTAYQTAYTYDGNGNLLSLQRRDSLGAALDSLSYEYFLDDLGRPTNKLKRVIDPLVTAAEKDIEGSHEYTYDEIGNLRRDIKDSLDIDWNVYGKVNQVNPLDSAQKPQITYLYDAAGNRVRKEVIRPDGARKTTHYIRDAQGNVLAIYEREGAQDGSDLLPSEIPLYGSDRLGMYRPQALENQIISPDSGLVNRRIAQKDYELKDHLDNMRVVLGDRKEASSQVVNDTLQISQGADVLAYSNYYPFGWEQEGRTWTKPQSSFQVEPPRPLGDSSDLGWIEENPNTEWQITFNADSSQLRMFLPPDTINDFRTRQITRKFATEPGRAYQFESQVNIIGNDSLIDNESLRLRIKQDANVADLWGGIRSKDLKILFIAQEDTTSLNFLFSSNLMDSIDVTFSNIRIEQQAKKGDDLFVLDISNAPLWQPGPNSQTIINGVCAQSKVIGGSPVLESSMYYKLALPQSEEQVYQLVLDLDVSYAGQIEVWSSDLQQQFYSDSISLAGDGRDLQYTTRFVASGDSIQLVV